MQLSAPALAVLTRGFAQSPEVTQRELLSAMHEATLLVEREVKENIHTGATGLTRASVTSDSSSTATGVLGVVGSSSPAATFVELGTKPHMPPSQALIPWVRAVLGVDAKRAPGVAFLVARKIARVGTKAQKPFERAITAQEAAVVRRFELAASKVAEHLAGSGA
ncbi:MAG TPA: hypothetical protein VLK85_20005 [Ramlibacter sp.]|nr:hypothetical protein [Ramlibacter sp.]